MKKINGGLILFCFYSCFFGMKTKDPFELLMDAQKEEKNGNIFQAKNLYVKIANQKEDMQARFKAKNALGLIFYKEKNIEKALQQWTDVIWSAPEAPEKYDAIALQMLCLYYCEGYLEQWKLVYKDKITRLSGFRLKMYLNSKKKFQFKFVSREKK